ncbi:MAG TPA: hypothetical protein VE669_09790 [Actinomycetota bacterium]|nr:hypothetical protein [Actinomycetota bacterium]
MNRPRSDGQAGLIGKLLVIWLLVAALVVVAAIDTATIVFTRIRMADIARDAAAVGATTLADGGGRRAVKRSVLGEIADRDEDAVPEDIRIGDDGVVSVTVFDRAGTILVGRFGLLESLAEVTASDSSGPSGP